MSMFSHLRAQTSPILMPIYRDNATPKIFIDTCSLLSEYADSFWKHLIPVLTNEKANIIVPLRVYEEVEKYANDVELCKRKAPDNPNLNQAAKHAKEKIIKYQAEGIVRVLGDKNDNFADNVFLTVFTQYRMKYNLILITQDKNLAADILRISDLRLFCCYTDEVFGGDLQDCMVHPSPHQKSYEMP